MAMITRANKHMTKNKYCIPLPSMAFIIGISPQTLIRWYSFYEDKNYQKPNGFELPHYKSDKRGTKFFKQDAVEPLTQMKYDISTKYRGCMADYNKRYLKAGTKWADERLASMQGLPKNEAEKRKRDKDKEQIQERMRILGMEVKDK